MRIKFLIVSFLIFATQTALSAPFEVNPQYKCQATTQNVEDKATEILTNNNFIFPSVTLLQDSDGVFSTHGYQSSIFEGYFRVEEDLDVELSKKANFELKLNHTSDIIYTCIFYDSEDLKNSHVTIYFLKGNALDGAQSFTTKVEAKLWGNKIKLAQAPIGFENIMALPHLAGEILNKIPGINLAYGIIKGIIREPVDIFGGTVLDITRTKVEGIVLTSQGVVLESDINDQTKSVFNSFTDFKAKL